MHATPAATGTRQRPRHHPGAGENLRRITQAVFLLLFLFLFIQTESKVNDELGYPVKFFLDFDPLIFVTTLLSAHAVHGAFYLSLVVIGITLLFGRIFCGWVCPLGTLNNLVGAVRKRHSPATSAEWYKIKYYVLVFLLVSSLFSMQLIGIMDPLSLLIRSLSISIYPLFSYGTRSLFDTLYNLNINGLSDVSETLQVVILALAVLIALSTLGIDIGPALAAAGILGLAISLGAQTLIRDVIGGLTILLEDEYRVGDQVKIDAVSGEVEQITLRRTDVRDVEGRLCMVPNGDGRVVANESREWARALVELNFGYEADVDKAIAALKGALSRLAADPLISPHLLDAPEIFGWNQFKEWSVVVRLSVKLIAGKQGDVARVMRQYAIEALQDVAVPVESCNRMASQPGSV